MRTTESIAADVLGCAIAHEPDSRLVGNVTAAEIVRLCAGHVMTCPRCGRERAANADDAIASYPDRCGADVEGVVESRCQEIAEAAAKDVLEAMLRLRFDDPTIRVDSMRMTSPDVMHVKAHRSYPIALITLDLHINQEI